MENPVRRLPKMIITVELHAVFCKITEQIHQNKGNEPIEVLFSCI